jgi:hypothetical protein
LVCQVALAEIASFFAFAHDCICFELVLLKKVEQFADDASKAPDSIPQGGG